MIIDCHGHYTTAPRQLEIFREKQKMEVFKDPLMDHKFKDLNIHDDEIRESIETTQLRLQRERGLDLTIFSPRASWMRPDIGNISTSRVWSRHCNDLIARVVGLFPNNFVGAAQLPHSPGGPIIECVSEIDRVVNEYGFVGCNLNPDSSGGNWRDAPLFDHYWYPLYEKLVELEVPAMIHVSGSCNANLHTTGSYYLAADTNAFMQLLISDLFLDFPTLKIIIPHGGGAVPYHWGRFQGIALDLKKPNLETHLLNNIFFDTCVYHQAGIDLLLDVIPIKNILFASEMFGAVRSINPRSGYFFDDTKRYVDSNSKITDFDRREIFENNARRVFPRLDRYLKNRFN